MMPIVITSVVLNESIWYKVIRSTRHFIYISYGSNIVKITASDIMDYY